MSGITVVRVPSIWSCKLPGGRWLNLIHIREMKVWDANKMLTILVVWENGNTDVFLDEEAEALLDAWEKAYEQQRDTDEGDRSGE